MGMTVGDIVKHCFYPDRPVGLIIELIRDDPKFFKIMWNDATSLGCNLECSQSASISDKC